MESTDTSNLRIAHSFHSLSLNNNIGHELDFALFRWMKLIEV
jgi:hypothetical protein